MPGRRSGAREHPARQAHFDSPSELPRLSPTRTLIVVPCSGRKRQQGEILGRAGISILDMLPGALAAELSRRRTEHADRAWLNESRLLPAAERYDGMLYQSAGSAFDRLVSAGSHVLIISGGYGVVMASEPIGWYEQKFRGAMWPDGLVGRCLGAYARKVNADTVVGLFCASTQYATAFRATRWPETVGRVFLLSPERVPGALVKGTRAQGEALKEIARLHCLPASWGSSDGLRVEVTQNG